MAFYNSSTEMYKARAVHYERDAKICYAKAMSGKGNWYFSKAKSKFEEAEKNRILALTSQNSGR